MLASRTLTDTESIKASPVISQKLCSQQCFFPGALTLKVVNALPIECRAEGARLDDPGQSTALLILRIIPKDVSTSKFASLNLKISELGEEVSRRRKAESELRLQKEMLRITLASIGDAVLTTDIHGIVTFLNPVAEQATGWTTAEALGRHLDEIFVIFNEETRLPVRSPVERVISERRSIALANHALLKRKDGSEIYIDDSGAPILDADGKMVGVVLVFHDISDLRWPLGL